MVLLALVDLFWKNLSILIIFMEVLRMYKFYNKISATFMVFCLIFCSGFVYAGEQPKLPSGQYLLIGPPGSGKGTIAARLSTHTGLPIIGMSQLIRDAIKNNGPEGQDLQQAMANGKLIDDKLAFSLLQQAIQRNPNGSIIDGFPRSINQAKFLAAAKTKIDYTIVLHTDKDILIKRLSGRRVHLPSGRIYHLEGKPPKQPGLDDISLEPLTQRADDKPEVISTRLELYQQHHSAIVAILRNLSKHIILLDTAVNADAYFAKLSEQLQTIQ